MFTKFLPLKVYGDFSRRSMAANSAVLGPIWPNFELVLDVMNVLVTYQYEKDPIKNRGARVLTTLYIIFFRRARADNSGVGGGIWPKFELIQAFMHVLVTCKRMIDSKMKELECSQDFSHYKSIGFFQTHKGS